MLKRQAAILVTVMVLALGLSPERRVEAQSSQPSSMPAGYGARIKKMAALTRQAIADQDPETYYRIMADAKRLKRCCPMYSAQYRTLRAKVEKKLERCEERLNWSRAKLVRIKMNHKARRDRRCPCMVRHGDIKFYFEARGKTVRVEIENPYSISGGEVVALVGPDC